MEKIKAKLMEMGYCVESVSQFFPVEGIEKTFEVPDSLLMVETCDGRHLTFNVNGDLIEERPPQGDELPFD